MKNKKSLIAIVAVLLVVVVGATFAYFNSNATFQNRFNLGNYNVVTQEVFTSPDNWSPGDTISKTLVAINNGSIDAAVRVSYIESWTDENGDEVDISDIPNNAVTIDFITPSQWTEDDGYYYYNYILKPGESTSSLIESVTLNSSLNDSSCVEENGVQICTSNIQGLSGYHYTLTFTIETVQYDQYQTVWGTDFDITNKPIVVSIPEGRTVDNLQIGDEICAIGGTTECFDFIRYDENNNIVMLSKWNLKVGDIYSIDGSTKTGEYLSTDPGYGLQSSETRGYVPSQSRNGTVTFSEEEYWSEGSSLKAKYGSVWDDNNIYDSDYNDATGENYSIAYYVENYKDKLEQYGLTVQDARLLTYDEATTNVGCSDSSHDCPSANGFIINTTFWMGSAYSSYGVWITTAGGIFGTYGSHNFGERAGVRPVIVISKSVIQ